MKSTKYENIAYMEMFGQCEQLDIVAEFELDKEALEKTAESNVEFSCSSSEGSAERGALGPFGLLVLADDSLSEQTPVYFYIAKGKDGSLKTYFCTDQSRYRINYMTRLLHPIKSNHVQWCNPLLKRIVNFL